MSDRDKTITAPSQSTYLQQAEHTVMREGTRTRFQMPFSVVPELRRNRKERRAMKVLEAKRANR